MKTTRIGPRMQQVVDMVSSTPRAVIDVAREVGPHGSLHYGYQTIHRAVRAGLVRTARPLPGRRGLSLEVVW